MSKCIAFPSPHSKRQHLPLQDLPEEELEALLENVERLKEEKPSKLIITSWADGKGDSGKKYAAAQARGNSIRDYYIAQTPGVVFPEIIVINRVATLPGPLWRRTETDIRVAAE